MLLPFSFSYGDLSGCSFRALLLHALTSSNRYSLTACQIHSLTVSSYDQNSTRSSRHNELPDLR